jgi:glyoxylase-like metal-dependent hydrolase (beta-lactamase superfamily II)
MQVPTLFYLFLVKLAYANTQSPPLNLPYRLKWDVYLAPEEFRMRDNQNLSISPTAFTLIHGDHSAVLVDAPPTIHGSHKLADWIEATIPGKKLTHIYITHGHGDHFLGLPILLQRFPDVVPVATSQVIAHMKSEIVPEHLNLVWTPVYPGEIALPQNEVVQALPANGILTLDGHVLKAVEVGWSDTYNTTVLHVPSLDLVVTGGVAYGECFL